MLRGSAKFFIDVIDDMSLNRQQRETPEQGMPLGSVSMSASQVNPSFSGSSSEPNLQMFETQTSNTQQNQQPYPAVINQRSNRTGAK